MLPPHTWKIFLALVLVLLNTLSKQRFCHLYHWLKPHLFSLDSPFISTIFSHLWFPVLIDIMIPAYHPPWSTGHLVTLLHCHIVNCSGSSKLGSSPIRQQKQQWSTKVVWRWKPFKSYGYGFLFLILIKAKGMQIIQTRCMHQTTRPEGFCKTGSWRFL